MFNRTSYTHVPKIEISCEAWCKINAYVTLCQSEISALGSAVVDGDTIRIVDVFLFDQVVTGTSTDLSSADISNFMCECIKSGTDPSVMKFWWHSHANMDVFWSGTDNGTINRFSSDWMVSMVSNKRGEFKVRFDMFAPLRLCIDDLPISIGYDASKNPEIQRELNSKVKPQFQIVREISNFFRNEMVPPRDYPYPGNDFGKRPPETNISDKRIDSIYGVPVRSVSVDDNRGNP